MLCERLHFTKEPWCGVLGGDGMGGECRGAQSRLSAAGALGPSPSLGTLQFPVQWVPCAVPLQAAALCREDLEKELLLGDF